MKRMLLCIFVSVFILLSAQSVFAAPVYNSGTGHWYDLVYGNWYASEVAAQSLGGHLVTINNKAEEKWLVSTFANNHNYWIGFNDDVLEGTWVWTSGEPVTYTNWASNEPNNSSIYGYENCAVMNWQGNWGWNDLHYTGYTGGSLASTGIAEYVPEPVSTALFLLGGAVLAVRRLRRKDKKQV